MGEALGKFIVALFVFVSITFVIYLMPGIIYGLFQNSIDAYVHTVCDITYGAVIGSIAITAGIQITHYLHKQNLI
jgi:ABC-type transport system involved in multi-copper enzyme maturation permease subunit